MSATNLNHIKTDDQSNDAIESNENVMIYYGSYLDKKTEEIAEIPAAGCFISIG